MNIRKATLVLILVLAPCANLAAGEWPMFRKDPQRTAHAPGVSRIDTPTVVWRHHLGGFLAEYAQWAADVNGDGVTEFIYIEGGKLVAKLPDDAVVWETPLLNLVKVEMAGDLDGVGGSEVVATSTDGKLYVFDGSDGGILWSMDAGVFDGIGAVRWADFDDDGLPDVYMADKACWGPDTAIGYTFRDGADSPTVLFQLERDVRDYVCGKNDSVGDFNGDETLDILILDYSTLHIFSTADGHLVATSEDLDPLPYGYATVDVRDVDGDGADDALCYTNNGFSPDINSKRLFLVGWDGDSFVKRWEMAVADIEHDQHYFVHNGMSDLDGEEGLEVATSFYESSTDTISTYIVDALTGVILDTLAGARVRGVVDVDGDGVDEIIVETSDESLACYTFASGSLSLLWSMSSISLVNILDLDMRSIQSAHRRPLALDLDEDGNKELIVNLLDAEGGVLEVRALNAETDPPTIYGSYALDGEGIPLTMQPFENITEEGMQVTMARSDGYLLVFDSLLQPVNEPSDIITGLRIGGYYSGSYWWGNPPVAGDMDNDGDVEIVVSDSKGTLVGLDANDASFVFPPDVLWKRARESSPAIVDVDGDGDKEMITGTFEKGDSRVRLVDSDGTTELWEQRVGQSEQRLKNDMLAADVTDDGTVDVLYHLADDGTGDGITGVLSGVDGEQVWPSEIVVPGASASGFSGSAFWDFTGDGVNDVFNIIARLARIYDGTDGSVLQESLINCALAVPTITDIDGDTSADIIFNGADCGVWAMDELLEEVWSYPSPDRRFYWTLGSHAACPSGNVFMGSSFQSPVLMLLDGETGELLQETVLAGGEQYATVEAAVDDGKLPGFLGNVTVKEDMMDSDTPGATIGSTDGFLYAVNPCSVSLLWSVDFSYPVGEAIWADTDADGADEIVVMVANGYVYGIDRERFPAPGWVYDTDPPLGITDEDVDAIETEDTLYAAWEPVPSTVSYEYAVFTAAGTIITEPDFIDVGTDTSVESSGLDLALNGRYYFAVRAIGPEERSAEALSDGVTVVDRTLPTIVITADPETFSPDDDGIDDSVMISVSMTDDLGLVALEVVIMDEAEETLVMDLGDYDLEGLEAEESMEWDGEDEEGSVVPAGDYVIVGTVEDIGGNEVEARAVLHVRYGEPDEDAEEAADAVEVVEPVADEADAITDAGQEDEVEGDMRVKGCGCSMVG